MLPAIRLCLGWSSLQSTLFLHCHQSVGCVVCVVCDVLCVHIHIYVCRLIPSTVHVRVGRRWLIITNGLELWNGLLFYVQHFILCSDFFHPFPLRQTSEESLISHGQVWLPAAATHEHGHGSLAWPLTHKTWGGCMGAGQYKPELAKSRFSKSIAMQ